MAKGFNITIDSKDLDRTIQRAIKVSPRETTQAVYDCLLDLAGNSALRAPVDTGDLRNDCTATLNGTTVFTKQEKTGVPITPSLSAYGEVGYGLPYAIRQHEELDYVHLMGGEAKYLERPFNERKEHYIERIGKVVDKSLK